MILKPSKPEAMELLMAGSAAFADIEESGMRVDVGLLDKTIAWAERKEQELEDQLRETEVFVAWKKRYGHNADLGSPTQLGVILFDDLGHESKHKTETGRPKTDVEALEEIDDPFIAKYITWKKLKKCRDTYLSGIKRELIDEFIRPFFNLHKATTWRSSSSDPNFQNQPVRDPRQAKLIRSVFIPRDGHVLVEIDQSALEFRGAANFWRDPAMVAYASDMSLDIHRDIAAECYLLDVDDVSKGARSHAKNSFVFPELYGSYWGNCAENLWHAIGRFGVESKAGVPLYEHLAEKGIKRLGSKKNPVEGDFTHLIKQVEESFNNRFSTWSERKGEWWAKYEKRGWFPILSGFVANGIFPYNNLMNTPIQGPSFHIVLWSMIQLHNWLVEKKMRSKIIGQIHDSIVGDVHKNELEDYLKKAQYFMTKAVRDHYKWIVTPLDVEAEMSETTWYEKKPIEIPV